MPLVILDRQHVGQVTRLKSLGASIVDSDGVRQYESMETARYIHEIELECRRQGYDVIVLSDGLYRERHGRVNYYANQYDGLVMYFACHINAGGSGQYGCSFYDYRSSAGERLARHIANECSVLGYDWKLFECRPDNWTKNAFYTIKGTAPVAICFEPYFIDNPRHREIMMSDDGRQRLALQFVNALNHYTTERT